MDVVEFGLQLIWSKAGNDLPQHRWKEKICWRGPQTQWWSITGILHYLHNLHYALMCLNIDFKCVSSLLRSVGAVGGSGLSLSLCSAVTHGREGSLMLSEIFSPKNGPLLPSLVLNRKHKPNSLDSPGVVPCGSVCALMGLELFPLDLDTSVLCIQLCFGGYSAGWGGFLLL